MAISALSWLKHYTFFCKLVEKIWSKILPTYCKSSNLVAHTIYLELSGYEYEYVKSIDAYALLCKQR